MSLTEGQKPIEILLIEDNPGDARLAEEGLRESRVVNRLVPVEDGEKALEYLRGPEPRPDLIILDLNLPGMDGREVLAVIKSDPELRRIPVVVLTTSSAEEDVLRSYDLHANCYITKPIDLDKFIRVVRSVEDFWLAVVKLPPKTELCKQ